MTKSTAKNYIITLRVREDAIDRLNAILDEIRAAGHPVETIKPDRLPTIEQWRNLKRLKKIVNARR
jgi:hypothetical protein